MVNSFLLQLENAFMMYIDCFPLRTLENVLMTCFLFSNEDKEEEPSCLNVIKDGDVVLILQL